VRGNPFQLTSLSTNVSQTVINKFRQSFYLPVNLWVPLREDRQKVYPTVIVKNSHSEEHSEEQS